MHNDPNTEMSMRRTGISFQRTRLSADRTLFMLGLRKTRAAMVADGLIHGDSQFPTSLTLITASVLLAIGVAAIVSMVS